MKEDNKDFNDKFNGLMEELSKENKMKTFYTSYIDNTNLEVKYKNILKKLLEVSCEIGGKVYAVGKIVLNVLIKIIEKFPYTALGLLVGYTLGLIASFVPIVGPLISPLVTPVLTLIGGAAGFVADAKNLILRNKLMKEISAEFNLGSL